MNATRPAASRGRILLVEDDPEAAYFAVHVLRTRGRFDVTHTADPAVALCRVSAESWDLVLTDLELPGMSGLELLDALRQVAPALPVAVVTARAGTDRTVAAVRRRADELLEKPLHIDQLVATASALISRGRAARPGGP